MEKITTISKGGWYPNLSAWEADLDNPNVYADGDDAVGTDPEYADVLAQALTHVNGEE